MASQEELDRIKQIRDLERELAGIRAETLNDVRDMSNFLSDSATALQLERAERNQIRSLARQINKIAQESYTISLNELGTSKNIAKIQKDRTALENKIILLNNLKNTLSKKGNENQKNIAENIEFQVQETQKLLAELKEVEETSSDIASKTRAFSFLEDLSKSIPGLRVLSKPFSEAADAARATAAAGGSALKSFGAGAKSLAQAAKAALPLLIIQQIADAFLRIDKASGAVAKNLGISYNQAIGLNREFNKIASGSDSIFITTENLAKSFVDINNSLGTNARLNEDLLITQTQLVQQAGYSVEAATQLSQLSLATGESSENITTEFLGQVKALNLQNNLAVNEKALLNSIANTSKGTLATFAGQTDQLARAAFQARKVGLELSQIEGIADNLLDIESSIAAEFEAEVISGRQLNLERARFFALTNDLEGLGRELEQQDITRASFQKASRIEQDAIAKSLGLSRDALGSMLIEQDALNALQNIEGKTGQERFNNLVKEVGLEEAKRRLGDETLANQLASVSAQERFSQSINKLKDVFVTLIDPLLPILDVFGQMFSLVGKIVKFLDPIIKTVGVIVSAFSFDDATFQTALDKQAQSIETNWGLSSKSLFTPAPMSDRNSGTVIDYEKLADAVSRGAEKGTSRAKVETYLDGDRVSSRLQTPGVINQRQYSI